MVMATAIDTSVVTQPLAGSSPDSYNAEGSSPRAYATADGDCRAWHAPLDPRRARYAFPHHTNSDIHHQYSNDDGQDFDSDSDRKLTRKWSYPSQSDLSEGEVSRPSEDTGLLTGQEKPRSTFWDVLCCVKKYANVARRG